MKVLLSFLDRYALSNLLPTSGTTYSKLNIREDILKKIKMEDGEQMGYLNEDQTFKENAFENKFEVEFSRAEFMTINEQLRLRDERGQFSIEMKHLYELFIMNKYDDSDSK